MQFLMSNFSLQAQSLSKFFGRRLIFKEINFTWSENGVYGVSGPNGSGKSTIVKIIAGLISASEGKIIHTLNNEEIISEKLHNHIGFVSPYLILYEEFSAWENLNIFAKIRAIEFNEKKIIDLLDRLKILHRKDDLVKTYSSGMKQRLKFVFALMHSPELIIFDEPTSNLDDEGKETVYSIVKNESKNSVVVLASNEKTDLSYCTEILYLEKYKV